MSPSACAAAVAASSGANGSRDSALRGPNCLASSNRRPASEGEIRNRNLGSSRHDLASKATGEAFGRQSGDHPVRLGGQLTRQGLQIVLGGQ